MFYLIGEHGRKIAYVEAEMIADVKNGWKVITKDEYFKRNQKEDVKATENKLIAETSEEDVEIVSEGKKRGRKPGSLNVNRSSIN